MPANVQEESGIREPFAVNRGMLFESFICQDISVYAQGFSHTVIMQI